MCWKVLSFRHKKIFSVSYASMGWLEKGSGCKSHTAAFTVIGDKRE